MKLGLTDGYRTTGSIGIAGEFWLTAADRLVVSDAAVSIEATRSRARIDALLADASPIARAITIDNTLWSTIGSCANHVGYTTASGFVIADLTNTVWPARCWRARISDLWLNRWSHN